jgi:2-octaprenylphenol hydroxylase
MNSPRSRTDFDVVIVGGGMVGTCLAALVAADERLAGWRVALLESTPPRQPRDGDVDLRVSAVSRASQRILEVAGAWQAIEPHACPYADMVVWDAASQSDARDAVHFSAAETGEPNLGHIAENLRVQWALHESPHLRSTTQLRSGFESVEFDTEAAKVHLADGRTLTCTLVIGADGAQSLTREQAGIGRAGWAYGQSAVVAHLRTGRSHRETAYQRFLPTGPLAFLPLRDGRVSLVWSTTSEEAELLLAAEPAAFASSVSAASDHVLGDVELASGRAQFPLGLWHAREYVRARLALVGDAAHTIHPLAGQGVNLGFLDCASLVQVLAKAVEDGDEYAGFRVLRRYERWRRSENALVMGACDTLNRVFTKKGMGIAAARRLGMTLVTGQPLLRRALVGRALGLGGDVPAIVKRTAE